MGDSFFSAVTIKNILLPASLAWSFLQTSTACVCEHCMTNYAGKQQEINTYPQSKQTTHWVISAPAYNTMKLPTPRSSQLWTDLAQQWCILAAELNKWTLLNHYISQWALIDRWQQYKTIKIHRGGRVPLSEQTKHNSCEPHI